jgi:hypothetical protein
VVALAVLGTGLAPPPAWAATVTICGYVYRDGNNNGVRESGEPGVPGIRVRHGSGRVATVTATDGSYTLSGLSQTGNLVVETGWLRSQCPAPTAPASLDCPAGPGRDNDFAAVNQFLRYPLTGARSATGVDVGLLPDWPGERLPPRPATGVVAANPVDVAARLSWVSDTCAGDSYHICRPGDTFLMTGQIYNQGTAALTGIRATIAVPTGDCLTGIGLVTTATAPGITGVTTTPAAHALGCGTRTVTASLTGALVAAGAIRLAITGITRAGPGTPGCEPAHPEPRTCTRAEPQGRGWLLAVSHIDQRGDPDSDFCAAADPRACPTGVHDKRRAPDEVDPVGHNVAAGLGGTTGYDLQMNYTARNPPRVVHPGDTVSLRAWAANSPDGQPANQVNPGTRVTVYLPAGTAVTSLPPRHALLTCATARRPGATEVACTYTGPLSPGLSAIAIDITVAIPTARPPTAEFRSVACLTPPAGQQSAERNPPGGSCNLTTDAAASPSNNDAGIAITVG